MVEENLVKKNQSLNQSLNGNLEIDLAMEEVTLDLQNRSLNRSQNF